MILLNILKKKKELKKLLVEKEYNKKLMSLKTTIKFLKKQKKFKNITKQNKLLRINYLNFQPKNDYVSYTINVNTTATNTIINVTDIKGNVLISLSSGLVNLTSRQKKQQPLAVISLIKVLIVKAKFLLNKPIAVHFKNTKSFNETLIINLLKNHYFIVSIQSYNLTPHNGCRPKKLKRAKVRTKRKVLR